MGYRSDGVIALCKEVYDELTILQIGLPKILEGMDFEDKGDFVSWSFTYYKMYDGYSEVDELNKFLSFLGGSESWQDLEQCPEKWQMKYQYIRIGENYVDIEESGQEWWYTVNRSIEIY